MPRHLFGAGFSRAACPVRVRKSNLAKGLVGAVRHDDINRVYFSISGQARQAFQETHVECRAWRHRFHGVQLSPLNG